MSRKQGLHFTIDTIAFPLLWVFSLWLVFWFEVRFNVNLNRYGVYPQKIEGLRGILFSPFIHSSLKHLFNNSIPLLVLTTALFYFYRHLRWQVLLCGLLATGALTWVLGRPAYHIGASGMVYMLASFLFFKGVLSKHFQLIALSLTVVFLYGGLLWFLFPIDEAISWEGHLSGFVVGALFALLFKKNNIPQKKYLWEREDYNPDDDPFMQQFDDDGNFIEKLPEEADEVALEEKNEESKEPNVKILYTFKKNSGDKKEL